MDRGTSLAEANVNRTATLAGTSIAIFTFLLFFLYPRYEDARINPMLFQSALMVIGLAIFGFVFAGLYYYLVTVPWPAKSLKPLGYLRTGDLFWFLGFSLLLVEPSLILFTVGLLFVAWGWFGLWVLYMFFNLREFGKYRKRNLEGYGFAGPR